MPFRFRMFGRATLYEGNVRLSAIQALQVFLRTQRWFQGYLDAMFRQRGRVFLAEFFIGAVFLPGRQSYLARWRRVNQPVSQRAHCSDQQQGGASRSEKITHGKTAEGEDFGHVVAHRFHGGYDAKKNSTMQGTFACTAALPALQWHKKHPSRR